MPPSFQKIQTRGRERNVEVLRGSRQGGRAIRVPPSSQERFNTHAEVHRMTNPARHRRACINEYLSVLVLPRQFVPITDWTTVAWSHTIEAFSSRSQEANGAVIQQVNDDFAFVNGSVMKAAQRYEVR